MRRANLRSGRRGRRIGFLLISVSDTGVGIPSEKVDLIFNAFYTTKPQGTGMGLAISRSIIEAHGGRLWATANAQRGATFHFTVPTEVHAMSIGDTATVFIIDDDAGVRESIRDLVESVGLQR